MNIKERIAETKAMAELLEWINERYERAEYDIRRAKERIDEEENDMNEYYRNDIADTELFKKALEKLTEKVVK